MSQRDTIILFCWIVILINLYLPLQRDGTHNLEIKAEQLHICSDVTSPTTNNN